MTAIQPLTTNQAPQLTLKVQQLAMSAPARLHLADAVQCRFAVRRFAKANTRANHIDYGL